MRIWYFSAYDQPNGQSSRTFDFSVELVRRGHCVTMLTNSYCHFTHVEKLRPGEIWREEYIDGIRVIWLRTIHYTKNDIYRGLNMLSNAWGIFLFLFRAKEKPDVVIGPSVPLFTGWAAMCAARLKKAAFVYEVRDIWPQALVDLGVLDKKSATFKVFRYIEKLMYRKANQISVVLPYTWKHVEESGGDKDKVTWIPNGANLERFSDIYNSNEESQQITVMYVGGFSTAHDISTILKAIRKLQDKHLHHIKFIFIGSGQMKNESILESQTLKLENVEFRDPVPKMEVPQILAKADILIASVKDSPVFRHGTNLNKLFDYLAARRPVIYSGVTPNDFVTASGAGITVHPENPSAMADAIECLAGLSSSERLEMGMRGREFVENEFDVKMLAGQMEALLFRAIEMRNAYGTRR